MTVAVKEDAKAMTPSPKHELAGAESTHPGPVFTPNVDIFENETALTLLADMPGVKPDGLKIDLRDNVLTIDGRVETSLAKDEQVVLTEYDSGSFHREFRLSNAIDQAKIEAKLRDGVLRLTLPKAEAARPRKIEVRG